MQQVDVFPSNSKISKANDAYRPMCKLSLLNVLLGLSLSLGRVGREHLSLTGAAAAGPGNEREAELVGGLTWATLLIGKMLIWYLSSKLNFCER